MGKQTRNDLRAMFAALNVRLGVWLPNLLDPEVDGAWQRHIGLFEVVRELFGFHPTRSKVIYVSDGGHYDNLGLVELLRKKCGLVICVDSSGDKPGHATALSQAMLLAGGELGCRFAEFDAQEFGTTSARGEPLLGTTHVLGKVIYHDGTSGTVLVIKLGLTSQSPSELHEYRETDKRFPHHSTLNQIFRAERFDAYRALGWDSTIRAVTMGAPALHGAGLRYRTDRPPVREGRTMAHEDLKRACEKAEDR